MTPAEERAAEAALRAWAQAGNLIEDDDGAPLPEWYQPVALLNFWLSAEQVSEIYRHRAMLLDRLVARLRYEGVEGLDQLIRECRADLIDIEELKARPSNSVSIGYRIVDQNPGHTRVQLFVGRNRGARGNAGELVLRTDEFEVLRDVHVWDEVPNG